MHRVEQTLSTVKKKNFQTLTLAKPHKLMLILLIPEWHLVFHITFRVSLIDHITVLLSLPTLTDGIMEVWRCDFIHFWFGVQLNKLFVFFFRKMPNFVNSHLEEQQPKLIVVFMLAV